MSRSELSLLRLVAQGVVGQRGVPADVVSRLLCLQGQDQWSSTSSLIVRSDCDVADVEAAFDAGEMIKTWSLRSTLHIVATADAGWLRALLAEREMKGAAGRFAQLDITAKIVAKAERVATKVLSAQPSVSRADLIEAWSQNGIDTSGQRAYHLIWQLAHAGLLCFGPMRDHQQLLVRADDWLPPTRELDHTEALAELALRYFSGHGPATQADLVRWANVTVRNAKIGIAEARSRLSSMEVAGVEYLMRPDLHAELDQWRNEANEVCVLPRFDEMLFGYRDRSSTLSSERSAEVFRSVNGVGMNTVLYKGEVVATWKRPAKHGAGVEIVPFERVSGKLIHAAQRLAQQIA